MKKNYYGILKVDKKAKPAQIKRAYRNAAKRYHPDVSPKSEEKFKEIQEAYETLSDPVKRASYDQELMEKPAYDTRPYRSDFRAPSPVRSSLRQPFSLLEEMDQFFAGFDHLWADDFRGFSVESERRHKDLFVEITLTPSEVRNGCEVPLKVPFWTTCTRCRGTGNVKGLICGLCRGRGEERLEKKIKVTIPPGVKNGMGIRIPLRAADFGEVDLIATFKVSRN